MMKINYSNGMNLKFCASTNKITFMEKIDKFFSVKFQKQNHTSEKVREY